jgi:hypothetical protein
MRRWSTFFLGALLVGALTGCHGGLHAESSFETPRSPVGSFRHYRRAPSPPTTAGGSGPRRPPC